MIRICPKCNYARQARDNAPEWQCPSCHVAYAKVGVTSPSAANHRSAAPAPAPSGGAPRTAALKWILAAAFIGLGIWIAKPFERLNRTTLVATAPASRPEVTLYSTEWCGYCATARTFFEQNNIQYKEMDIEKTTAGYEEHKRLGGNGVPLLVIGDEVIHGYSEQTMRRTLKPWLKGTY